MIQNSELKDAKTLCAAECKYRDSLRVCHDGFRTPHGNLISAAFMIISLW